MSSLWSSVNLWRVLDPQEDRISDVFSTYHLKDFLPYKREYNTLSNKELLELIEDAKRFHWQALDLSMCGLSELPDELWELKDLRILFLDSYEYAYSEAIVGSELTRKKNTFSIIPKRIEGLSNLQALSLSGNTVTVDKNDPLILPNLRYLGLYNCGFKQLPEAFLIPSIEAIGFNCLEDRLSDSFARLINLHELYLARSNIETLPSYIGQFNHLKLLSLSLSKITGLPSSILNLNRLKVLDIEGTPLSKSLPPEILHQSARAVIKYIINQQSSAQKEYFNESKLIIVGQGSVGKTSLLKRLVSCKFDKEESTEGINISKWDYKVGKNDIRLNVWDFGGQEIYHATHQFFLTKRSLYLLVWDVLSEKEYGRIDYWLRTIQSLAGDSPIIIVVNKCDQGIGRIDRLDLKEYTTKYPQIVDIMYVSCKDNYCIGKLRKLIKATASKLPLMRIKWLKTWMDVRRRIEQKATEVDSILYSEYQIICKECGIINEDEALSLIQYLHDLGIVLYYHDDPLLKGLVILSSEWGTDAVYRIVDEQERRLKGRNGVLLLDDLSHIWKDSKKYPKESYPYLLNLMMKFQLAFNIDQNSYLVAELLNNESIDLKWTIDWNDKLSFRYEYDFLPAGVMTRFIVSANQYLITKDGIKQCWRKGAYLSYRSAKALVRLYDDISERYVQIDVIGESSRDKREFLGIIRSKLDDINNRFTKIVITPKIPCCCSKECTYMFNYNQLLIAERKGKRSVQCQISWDDVSLSRLLDGIEDKKTRLENLLYSLLSDSISSTYKTEFIPYINMGKTLTMFTINENNPDRVELQIRESSIENNINNDLLRWAMSSSLYKKAVGSASEDKDTLRLALGDNETKRYQNSFALMKAVWHNHPELGVAPDYKLLSEMEYSQRFYSGYRDHTTHMFKVFLLGLYLFENSEKISGPIKTILDSDDSFLSVWIMTALYHDIGYIIETEDGCWDSEDGKTVLERFNEGLIYPMANMFPDVFDEGTEKALQFKTRNRIFEADQYNIQLQMEHFKGMGPVVRLCADGAINPIKNYYDYASSRRSGRVFYDHGIVSACMLLHASEEVCHYMEEMKKNDILLQPNQKEKLDVFLGGSDKFKQYASMAAQAIALHNIHKNWNPTEIAGLNSSYSVTISSFTIPQAELPIAYLLRVCDELQCWDRQNYRSPLDETRISLDTDKLSIRTVSGNIEFLVKDEQKRKDIAEALSGVLDPRYDQVLTLK